MSRLYYYYILPAPSPAFLTYTLTETLTDTLTESLLN